MNNFKKNYGDIQMPNEIYMTKNKDNNKRLTAKFVKKMLTAFIILGLVISSLSCGSINFGGTSGKKQYKGSIFNIFTDIDLKKAQEEGLTCSSNQQQTFEGVNVELKDIYYDRMKFSFGILVNGGNEFEPIYFALYYNGKIISSSIFGGVMPVSKNEYMRCFDVPLTTGSLPEKCKLNLCGTDATGKIKKYDFEIPVNFSKVDALTKEIILKKSCKTKFVSITANSVVFTPTSTVINYKCSYLKNKDYHIQLLYGNNNKMKYKEGINSITLNNNIKTQDTKVFLEPLNTVPSYLTFNVLDVSGEKIGDNKKNIIDTIKLKLK